MALMMTRIICGQGHHRHFDYFFILPQYKVQYLNFDIGQEVDIKFVWLYEDNFSKTLFWQIYQNYFFSEKLTPFHNTHSTTLKCWHSIQNIPYGKCLFKIRSFSKTLLFTI